MSRGGPRVGLCRVGMSDGIEKDHVCFDIVDGGRENISESEKIA